MPAINGEKLPKPVVDGLRMLLDELEAEIILNHVKLHRKLATGFPLSKKSVPAFRKRLAATFKKRGELEPAFLDLLSYSGIAFYYVRNIPNEVIAEQLPFYLSASGPGEFLAGLLVDPRQSVREIALEYLLEHPDDIEAGLPSQEDAIAHLRTEYGYYLNVVFHVLDFDAEKDSEKTPTTPSALQPEPEEPPELKELRRENANLTKIRTKLENKYEKLQNDSGAKLKKAREKIEDLKQANTDSKGKRTSAEKELQDIKNTIAREVEARLDKEMESLLRKWLNHPERIDREISKIESSGASNDVLVLAEKALEKQAKADRHSGNRRDLNERLERLHKLKGDIESELADSLNPISELQPVLDKLNREAENLNDLLGLNVEDREVVRDIKCKISDAPGPNELEQVKELLETLDKSGLLRKVEAQSLYKALQDKMTRIYDASGPKVVGKAVPDDPAIRLRHAIDNNEQMVLLLDGHNIILSMPDQFPVDQDKPGQERNAREKLVTIISQMVADSKNIQTKIFFDGPHYKRKNIEANIEVIYSGGKPEDKNRADKKILEDLEVCCREMSAMPRMVVTNDRDLCTETRTLRARYLRLGEFAAILNDYMD